MSWSLFLSAALGLAWLGDVPVDTGAAGGLMAHLNGHDRLGMACLGPPVATIEALAGVVDGGVLLGKAGDLSGSFKVAATDVSSRAPHSLVWLRLGDDPTVGAVVGPGLAPLAAGDKWTDHWTESPRLRAGTDRVLRITPHGRVPSEGQWRPAEVLGASGLPDHTCAAWSVKPDVSGQHKVERLLAVGDGSASLRVAAASARRSDVGPRVDDWSLAPSSRRHPSAVLVVNALPHVVTGAPWLQSTDLPKKVRGLGSLIPTGYTPAGGQVRAWYDDVSGAAMAVILPLTDALGQPADSHALLSDVRDRFALSGEVEPAGRGGRLQSSTGGVHIGALPGALLLSTDAQVLSDLLSGEGRPWSRPPSASDSAAGWWLAGPDHGPASTGVLFVEDGTWRVDAAGGTDPIDALSRTRAWAGIK